MSYLITNLWWLLFVRAWSLLVVRSIDCCSCPEPSCLSVECLSFIEACHTIYRRNVHRQIGFAEISHSVNVCISDLPTTLSRMYAYADNLAIMYADGDWQAVEGAVSKDMATVNDYLRTWKLNFSTAKKVSAAFHLNNKEAKLELNINFNNEALPFCSELKYFRVTLDRSLTHRRHLESLRKKLTSCVALLKRLA